MISQVDWNLCNETLHWRGRFLKHTVAIHSWYVWHQPCLDNAPAKSVLMIGNLAEKPENLKTVSHHPLMTRLTQSRYGITGVIISPAEDLAVSKKVKANYCETWTVNNFRSNQRLRWQKPRTLFYTFLSLGVLEEDKDGVINVLIYENVIENKSFAESQQALSHKSESWEFFSHSQLKRKGKKEG